MNSKFRNKNKKLKKLVAALCLAGYVGLTGQAIPELHAQAALVPFAADMAVSDVIGNIRESAKEVINSAKVGFSDDAFQVRQHIDVELQLLDQVGQSLIGKTFGDLKDTQRQLFIRVNDSIQQMRDASNQTLDHVNDTIAQTNDLLGTIPLAYRKPRVLRVNPAYVLGRIPEQTVSQIQRTGLGTAIEQFRAGAKVVPAPQTRGPVTFEIDGSWLGEKNSIGEKAPSLRFGKVACDLVTITEPRLTYACPGEAFNAGVALEYRTGILTLYERRSFWEKVGDLFGAKERTRTYTVGTFIVPAQMGAFRVTATVARTTREYADRVSPGFYHMNAFCERPHDVLWTVNRTQGWNIDPHSIAVNQTAKNGDTHNYGAINRGESGFQLSGVVRNEGGCGPFWKDARGWLGLQASYREYRDVPTEQTVELGERDLFWGKDANVELPEGTKAFRVEVSLSNGTKVVEVQEQHSTRWYKLAYNPNNREIVIHPEEARIALR